VCCSVWQCLAVSCSVLQYVAVCFSMSLCQCYQWDLMVHLSFLLVPVVVYIFQSKNSLPSSLPQSDTRAISTPTTSPPLALQRTRALSLSLSLPRSLSSRLSLPLSLHEYMCACVWESVHVCMCSRVSAYVCHTHVSVWVSHTCECVLIVLPFTLSRP